MTTIHADELRPGDIVDDHGQRHCVTHIDRHGGWAFPVAFDDAGWGSPSEKPTSWSSTGPAERSRLGRHEVRGR